MHAFALNKPVQQFWIPETSLYKFTAAHQPPVSGGQVVQNNHLTAVIHQLPNHMRADIPCPADNENFFIHCLSFLLIVFNGLVDCVQLVVAGSLAFPVESSTNAYNRL
jgi:hypothetical protein